MSRVNQNLGLLPFDDIRALVADLPGFDQHAANVLSATIQQPGGRAAEIATWMAGWQGQTIPKIRRPVVALFAASHAVAGGLPDGLQVNQVVELIASVQARSGPVAQACDRAELGLKVFELAPELPLEDFSAAAAMAENDCAATIAYGMEATTDGCDLLVVRAIAAGGHASITAMATALLGEDRSLDELRHSAEIDIVGRAIATHRAHLRSPLEVLRRLGGREAAAIAGAIVAARLQRVPVIVDGSQAVCVALLLEALRKGTADHCITSCCDMHPDSLRLCEALGRPVLLSGSYDDLDGTSGALAAAVVADVISLFEDAGRQV